MGITFLKSNITGLLNKFGISWKHRSNLQEVKSFKENQKNEEAFDTVDRGICSVPVNQIVGSVGRYHDFDSKFRLKRYIPPERLQHIKKAMQEGKPLPPVKLYQIKNEYYVLDGNHRISAAKEFGYHDIDADIIEFVPSKDTLENILYREKAELSDKTGLSYSIELTEVGQYTHLINQISRHRSFLEKTPGEEPASFKSAAEDWYKTIYRPLTEIIEKGRLIKSFPKRTVADLYAYITFHQWEKNSTRKYGGGIDQLISNNMEAFREKMSDKKELEYPEMQREITAFILMNVTGKKEDRILEKLYALEEVREIHSVHGDVDILVKIVLTRDLVSSDAEIIGNFVHNQVRQISGVISTQTLIPGFSKIKANHTEGR
ncbi:MAG: Lrp/AsnC ligand binding domain-containing protein [Desulfobacteraceae bacterium]|nr:Lrp/AsnC ligand binding domain-containing protein [Desulfobacteraceae bacterium]